MESFQIGALLSIKDPNDTYYGSRFDNAIIKSTYPHLMFDDIKMYDVVTTSEGELSISHTFIKNHFNVIML